MTPTDIEKVIHDYTVKRFPATPLDTLGRNVELPRREAGDLLAVLQSDAYAVTASPVGVVSHPMPADVLISDGQAKLNHQP